MWRMCPSVSHSWGIGYINLNLAGTLIRQLTDTAAQHRKLLLMRSVFNLAYKAHTESWKNLTVAMKIQICAKRKNIGRFQTLGVCKLMLLYIFPRCLCTHFAWPNIKLYSFCTHVQLPGARLASDVSSNHSKVSRYLLCSDWSIRCLEMMKENCDVLTPSPR